MSVNPNGAGSAEQAFCFTSSLRSWRNCICARSLFARVVLAAKPPFWRRSRHSRGKAARSERRRRLLPILRAASSLSVSSPFSARLLLFYQAKPLRARTIPPATQAISLPAHHSGIMASPVDFLAVPRANKIRLICTSVNHYSSTFNSAR